MQVASFENSKDLYHKTELKNTDMYYQHNKFTGETKLLTREEAMHFDRECVVYPAYDAPYLKKHLGDKATSDDPDKLVLLATPKN